jgi:nucleoside-diphosphate-sugar epimerase
MYTTDFSNYQYAQFTSDLSLRALQANVEHLIILGTCAEYGPQTGPSCAGRTELNPSNLYAQQKIVALNLARETLLGSETRLSWARVFQPYGPNQDSKRLIPYLVDSLKQGRKIDLNDNASIHDWITTRDIASAISWIICHSTPIEIDVGTTIGYTNLELLQHLEALIGGSNQWMRISDQVQVGGGMVVVANDSPLFVSGWLPSDSLDKGLEWAFNL